MQILRNGIVFLFFLQANIGLGSTSLRCPDVSTKGSTANNGGPSPVWDYTVRESDGEVAQITIDGFQTASRIEARSIKKADGTHYLFERFAEDSMTKWDDLKPGDELFMIRRGSREKRLVFSKLKSNNNVASIACDIPPDEPVSVSAQPQIGGNSVFVEEEKMGKTKVVRVRIVGPAAFSLCRFLGTDLAKQPSGSIVHHKSRTTCFTTDGSGEGRFGFGFLIDKDLKMYHLEAGGYR